MFHIQAITGCYLEDELLVAGTPLPSRLARPGPARAPRPPADKTNIHDVTGICVSEEITL